MVRNITIDHTKTELFLTYKNKEKTFCVKCSYFEIYNENVYDLLKSKNSLDEAL